MTVFLTPSELGRALATPWPGTARSVVVVIDDNPSSECIAHRAAELAAQENCRLTVVVTWNDRLVRYSGNPWFALPFTCADVSGWQCDWASQRARGLMTSLGESPGFTYFCRKGRTKAVARDLAQEYGGATIVVGVPRSSVGRWWQNLRFAGRREIAGDVQSSFA